MQRGRKFSKILLKVAPGALAIFVIVLFVGYAVIGPNGVMAWGDYRRQHQAKSVELAKLEIERASLANRVQLLDPNGANPDLADELVRKELGVVGADEIVLPVESN